MNRIPSFVSRLLAGVATFVSDRIVTVAPLRFSKKPVVTALPFIVKFVTDPTSKYTVSRTSVTIRSYADARPVFVTTSVIVLVSPASIRFVANDFVIAIKGSTFVVITTNWFVAGGCGFPV